MRSTILIAIGQRIREQRQNNKMSQESMADAAGLDRAYYGGIERGERNVAAINLVKIACALQAEVGELFPSLNDLKKAGSNGR